VHSSTHSLISSSPTGIASQIDVGLPWPLRICSVSISIFGILLFAAILGIVVDKIMSILESLRHGRTAVAVEGHTLLLNWTEKSDTLIVQLALSMLSEGGGTIVVLSESEKLVVEADMRDRFANVFWRRSGKLLHRPCVVWLFVTVASSQHESRRDGLREALFTTRRRTFLATSSTFIRVLII
jgi:hypothetical protein